MLRQGESLEKEGLNGVRHTGSRAISPNAVRENVVTMEDIAGAVFFLFDNRGVNGIDLKVDGGGLLV